MDRKRRKCTLQKVNYFKSKATKENLVERVSALEHDLAAKDAQLNHVTAELDHLKNERSKDKINFEAQKLELDRYKKLCAKYQSENENLKKDVKDLQSARPNVEQKSQMNLQITNRDAEVKQSDADAFASLPDECVLKIFGYITQNQLGQIARVCKRFHLLTRDPVLWRKVDVEFHWSHRLQNHVVNSFLNTLPYGVTFIRFNFLDCEKWKHNFNFEELCMSVQQKHPKLKILGLVNACIVQSLPLVVIDLSSQFLPDLKILELRHSRFGYERTEESHNMSKIEVLDMSFCEMWNINQIPFSQMPELNKLFLSNTEVDYFWLRDRQALLSQLNVLDLGGTRFYCVAFQILQMHAFNLKELYLCYTQLTDQNFKIFSIVLPNLKAMCIRGSLEVTDKGIISIIQSCPSLQTIYVNQEVILLCAANPFMVANKEKLEILKVISSCYDHPGNTS